MSDTTDSLLGTAVGLIGLGIALKVFKKVTGKSVDDDLKVEKSSSKDSFW
jgi:hypothetical protein